MRRVLLVMVAVTVPFSGVVLGLSSPASASAVKITCTQVVGNEALSHLTGCSGGNTGGTSAPFTGLAGGASIPWTSGNSTTLGTVNYAVKKATKCPGYVKGSKKAPYSGPEPTMIKISGTVTADNGDGIKIPGKFKGEVCISDAGNLSFLKPVVIT